MRTGSGGERVRFLRWAPLACALAFIAIQLSAAAQHAGYNDSYRYGVYALRLLGVPQQEAHDQALRIYCRQKAEAAERTRNLDPWQRYHEPSTVDADIAACLAAHPTRLAPSSPRYQAIFDTRPGFPLLAAPFVKVLGLARGMLLASLALGAAGGLMVFLLLRIAGAPRGPALVGQLLYYALPTGFWASRTLSEGTMLLATFAVLAGAWLLVRRRIGLGLTVTLLAQLFCFSVKYSQVPMLGIGLAGAAAGIWLFARERRHAGTLLLGASGLAALAAGLAVPRLLSWPGFHDSLQDTFTHHFQEGPDVADPMSRLVELNAVFWAQWWQEQAQRPLLLLATVAGAVALWRWSRPLALIVLAAAATGIATEIAHPLWEEGDRLYVAVWLVAVFGLPLLWPLIRGDGGSSADGGWHRDGSLRNGSRRGIAGDDGMTVGDPPAGDPPAGDPVAGGATAGGPSARGAAVGAAN